MKLISVVMCLGVLSCGRVPESKKVEPPKGQDVSGVQQGDDAEVFRRKAQEAYASIVTLETEFAGKPATSLDQAPPATNDPLRSIDLLKAAVSCSDAVHAVNVASRDTIGSLKDMFTLLLQPPASFEAIQNDGIALGYHFTNQGSEGVIAGGSDDKVLKMIFNIKGPASSSKATMTMDLVKPSLQFKYQSSSQRKKDNIELQQSNLTEVSLTLGAFPKLVQSVQSVLKGTDSGKAIDVFYKLVTEAAKAQDGSQLIGMGRTIEQGNKPESQDTSNVKFTFDNSKCTLSTVTQ